MAANDTRVVAIEVKSNVASLKASVDALKTAVDAIHAVTDTYVVNSDDVSLPTDASVKEQLAAYNALSTTIIKPANNINDSIAVVNEAV